MPPPTPKRELTLNQPAESVLHPMGVGDSMVYVPLSGNHNTTSDGLCERTMTASQVREDYRNTAARLKRLEAVYKATADQSLRQEVLHQYDVTRERKAQTIADDANLRYIRWVAGHLGEDNVKRLYQTQVFETMDGPIDTHPDTGPGEDDTKRDRTLRDTGRLCFLPTVISARDAAYHKMRNVIRMHLGSRLWQQQLCLEKTYENLLRRPHDQDDRIQCLSPSPGFTMDAIIADDELGEIFARLTAAQITAVRHRNPRRWYSASDRGLVKAEDKEICHSLKQLLRTTHPRKRKRDSMFLDDYGMELRFGF